MVLFALMIAHLHFKSLSMNLIPYIANRLRWKSFVIAKLNCNFLENIHSWTVVLHGQSLFAQAISLEKFRGYLLINKNYETFPPQMIYNIQ